ncbi:MULTISPECIES: hypothetical protein [Streptomyces]|uniref:hypothetical protein n=1 Tax=Streptomyces TaxID=1883 RepID=UPI0004CCD8A9|nr:hypothetical protein [Streptomyces durhamensis]
MSDTSTIAHVRPRRATLRALGLWLALVAAVFTGAAAASTAAADPVSPAVSPVGTWTTAVTIGTGPDAVTSTSHFTFAADHTLTTDGAPGPDGTPQYPGSGYWTARPDGAFAFSITHGGPDVADSGGTYPGTVYAVHQGRIVGNTFTTTAVAFTVVEKTGARLGPITVSARGTRVP